MTVSQLEAKRGKTIPPEALHKTKTLKPVQIILGFFKYGLLITLGLTYLLPIIWMFLSSLKDDPDVFTIPPVWIPKIVYWNNFVDAWQWSKSTTYLINSIFHYSLPVMIFSVFSSAIIAYGFARLRFPGRNILFSLCLATMMIPYTVLMVPQFLIFKSFGWVNTYRPMVIPALCGNAFFIFLLRQFYLTIPTELTDAAKIDGANEFQIFAQICLPLVKPALAVCFLFAFLWSWNDFLGPLIYLRDQEKYPLALGLELMRRTLHGKGVIPRLYPYIMAISTIITAPILILFFVAQRYFIEGIKLTGIKG